MVHIVAINTTEDGLHFDQIFNWKGTDFRISQYCTNYDYELAAELINTFDGLCDVLCLSGLPPVMKTPKGHFQIKLREQLLSLPKHTPIVDGTGLKEVYMPYILRKHFASNPRWLRGKNVSFVFGCLQQDLLEIVEAEAKEIILGDAFFLMGLPKLIYSKESLAQFISYGRPIYRNFKPQRKELKLDDNTRWFQKGIIKKFFESQVIVASYATFDLIDPHHFEGKKIIIDVIDQRMLSRMWDHGVEEVLVTLETPDVLPFFSYSLMEGILCALNGGVLSIDKLLELIDELDVRPILLHNKDEEKKANASTTFSTSKCHTKPGGQAHPQYL